MRTAQELFEGVVLPGRGPTGLITYMDRQSRVAPEAQEVPGVHPLRYSDYLPAARTSMRRRAFQNAHEAIRPTSVELALRPWKGSHGRADEGLFPHMGASWLR